MQPVFFETKLFLLQIIPHQKSNSPNNDQQHNRYVHQIVAGKCHQRGILFLFPHQVKARIAESRDRMKNPVADTLYPTQPRDKPNGQKYCSDSFYEESSYGYLSHQPDNPAYLQGIHAFLQDAPFLQANVPLHQHRHKHAYSHKSQPAYLNQHQKNYFPKH